VPSAGGQTVDEARLARIEHLIVEAIESKALPGAVVVVGRGDEVVYRRAFGKRALVPSVEPMTEDTIFDAASLTKVVATTTSVMLLVEQGRIRLTDRVADHIPGFGRYGKEPITVRHLLTHMSGLRPDLDWSFPWTGYDTAIDMATEEVPVAAPNERFIYSDINFFLLGDIVRRVSGLTLDVFVRTHVFEPLGMVDTTFLPPAGLRPRIAPTESCTEYDYPCEGPGPGRAMLRGVVHDPTARRMHGVAGHAGLFTTAADLTIFCRMLLGGGAVGDVRVLSPLTVAKMVSPATPAGQPNVRGLGWDLDSSFSVNRGELLPLGSFGHTGFTGTSLWVDPATRSFVIFLSNRVHPDGKGDVAALRARVATVAASALTDVTWPARPSTGTDFTTITANAAARAGSASPVLAGIDRLAADGFKALAGKRIALLTNHTGVARDGRSTIDVLRAAPGVTLVSLFSPEHGIRGVEDTKVDSSVDARTGLPIHSLYGATRRPTGEMLQGIDTVVIDLQDVGTRFYTYMTSMAYMMEEAARRSLDVIVLDRPNPIGGVQIEGPALDGDLVGFTGYLPMPTRHGLTLGELARLFNDEVDIGSRLTVVEMAGWRRDAWFDQTGVSWVGPSPNIRNLHQALLYPGIGSIEWSNLSVGRGTDAPFEQIGAPWIDGARLAEYLNARKLAGISFYPVHFTPSSSKFAGERCGGVFMVVTDRDRLRPVRTGLEIAAALIKLHGDRFELEPTLRLLGSADTLRRLRAGEDPAAIAETWAADEARWRLRRARYVLYR
jgi:uncharacterized protein YbbC (DUF1343 family)/CubicO group peptidase (beta-lactamase class C family)